MHCRDGTSGIELCRVGDGFAFRTRAEIAERLNTHRQVERPLSRAALEVLAIVAYHQPITRAEIEEVRGISLSRGTIDILLELERREELEKRECDGILADINRFKGGWQLKRAFERASKHSLKLSPSQRMKQLKAEAREKAMAKKRMLKAAREARAKDKAEAKARLAKQIQKQREVLDKYPALDKFARSFCGVRISRTLVRSSRYELVMKRLYRPGGAGYEGALADYKGALALAQV